MKTFLFIFLACECQLEKASIPLPISVYLNHVASSYSFQDHQISFVANSMLSEHAFQRQARSAGMALPCLLQEVPVHCLISFVLCLLRLPFKFTHTEMRRYCVPFCWEAMSHNLQIWFSTRTDWGANQF